MYKSAIALSVQGFEHCLVWGRNCQFHFSAPRNRPDLERVSSVLPNCRLMNIQHSRVLIPFDYSGHCENSNSYY